MACWCFRGSRDLNGDPRGPSRPSGPPTAPIELSGVAGEHLVLRQPLRAGYGHFSRTYEGQPSRETPRYPTWHGHESQPQFKLVFPPLSGSSRGTPSSGMRTPPYGIGRTKEPPPLATSTPRHDRTPRPSPSPSLQERGTRTLQSPARVRTSPPKGYISSSRGSKAASPLRGRVPMAVTDRGAPRRRPRRSQGRRAPRSRNSHDANTSSQSVCHSTKPPVTFPRPIPLPRDDTVSDISIVSPMPALDVSYTAYLTPDVLTPTAIPPSPPTSRAPSAREIWDFDDEEAYVQHNPLYWLVPEAHEQPEPRERPVAPAPHYYQPHTHAPLPDTYIGHRPAYKPAPRWSSPYGRGRASPVSYLHRQEERGRGRGVSPGTHAHLRLSPISENSQPTNIVTYADVHTQERPHRQPRGRSFKPSPPRRHRLAAQRKRSNIRIFDLKDDARFVYIVHALIQAFIYIEQV